jgi:hypothetical protein
MNWKFLNKDFIEPIEDIYGFIYMLTYENKEGEKKYYIGKKNFWFYHEKKALKNDKKRKGHIYFKNRRKDGHLVKYELFKKESDWKTYTGSYKGDLIDLKLISKDILCFARSKRELTYLETKMLFNFSALERDDFLNDNILGKFFRGNLV